MISSHFQVPPPETEPVAAEEEEEGQGISESRKHLLEVFQEQDRNRDGYLDVEELRYALRKLGHYITGRGRVGGLENNVVSSFKPTIMMLGNFQGKKWS